MTYSIKEQIKCVEREIEKRQWIYPNRVLAGKMTPQTKDREISLMEDVLNTLRLAERAHLDKPWNQPHEDN